MWVLLSVAAMTVGCGGFWELKPGMDSGADLTFTCTTEYMYSMYRDSMFTTEKMNRDRTEERCQVCEKEFVSWKMALQGVQEPFGCIMVFGQQGQKKNKGQAAGMGRKEKTEDTIPRWHSRTQLRVLENTYVKAKATRAPLTTIKSKMFHRSRKYEPWWSTKPRSTIWEREMWKRSLSYKYPTGYTGCSS